MLVCNKRHRGWLGCTISMVALSVSTAAVAQESAQADSLPAEDALVSDEQIIVTGTRIRGVAPVGSSIIQVGAEDIARTGQTSTADILNNLPSVLSLGAGDSYSGGTIQGGADLNALAFNKSPNLRGLGPQATLSLVNGRRVPYDGANMNAFDGDNIPAQMLQRVEVVADGTSPIYGADAIAGTVNYILRDPFTGIEAHGQYGLSDGRDTYQITAVGGYDWGTGGIVLSYQYTNADRLRAGSRPTLYSDDYRAFGGPGPLVQPVPGNIVVNGVDYAIPGNQDGTALLLSDIGPAGQPNYQNSWEGYDAVPQFSRDNFAYNFKQEIMPGFEIFSEGFYAERDYDIDLIGPVTGVTLTVPNSNFYSPCNRSLAGAPAALIDACATGALTVEYNTLYDAGAKNRSGYTKTWNVSGGATIDLFSDFQATISASYGKHDEESLTKLQFGNALPSQAALLGGMTADSAFNPFCDARNFDCNPSSFNSAINGSPFLVGVIYEMQDYALNIDGPLFELPGGQLRAAVGLEHYRGQLININSFGEIPSDTRKVNSAFAELFVPLFGPSNSRPFLRELELNIAGRVDDYSDVGTTTNPKIGINWKPTEDLRFHASYGRSFRAPGLADNNPNSPNGYLTPGGFPGNSIDPSLCPSCAGIPNLTIAQVIGGANGDLEPEKSRSYSFGADFEPDALPGLRLSLNYWNVEYTGQVSTAVYNAGAVQAINQQYFNDYIVYNPSLFPDLASSNPMAFLGTFPQVNLDNPDCAAVFGENVTSQAAFNQMVACINAGGAGPLLGAQVDPDTIAALQSARRINAGSTQADGFDIDVSYSWDDGLGSWRLGAIAQYILNWEVAVIPGAEVVDRVNNYSYPLRFSARGELSWSEDIGPGNLSASLFANYSNAYEIDANLLPPGVPSEYSDIGSHTTFDLRVSFDTGIAPGSSLLNNLRFTVSAQNIFDELPPLVLNSGGQAGIMFDPANASPLGRVVQFQISKAF